MSTTAVGAASDVEVVPWFVRPRDSYPAPTRRPRIQLMLLRAAALTQMAVAAVLAISAVSGEWVVPVLTAAGFVAMVAALDRAELARLRRTLLGLPRFDFGPHPQTAAFVAEVCERYGIEGLVVVEDAKVKSAWASSAKLLDTPIIVVHTSCFERFPDDSEFLRAVFAHELAHIIRDHTAVTFAVRRLFWGSILTAALAVLAVLSTAGEPSTATVVAATALLGTATSNRLESLLPSPLRFSERLVTPRLEREAELGSIGLLGPAEAFFAAVFSVYCDPTNPFATPFDRASAGYMSAAEFMAEATGCDRWLVEGSEAWEWMDRHFRLFADS